VATWDATLDLINALKKGEVDLVLAQKPMEIGSLAVEWGYKYLKDKTPIPNKKLTPGFFVFTKENVDAPDAQQYIYTAGGE
jgi:ribose transport system substrate-binding protein